jgi:hypothetical protein
MKRKCSELLMLREKCAVMRNLLRDISENENYFYSIPFTATTEEVERALHTRSLLRRSLIDEVDHFLALEVCAVETNA